MKLTDIDRRALALPPPGYADAVVEEGGTHCDCGDALLSERERHLHTCNPCLARQRQRWEAARAARRAAGGRE